MSKQIFAAFVKAQTGFSPALKTSTNPHFKSKYADLATCVEAVIDSLNANGIGLMQKTHLDDTGVTVETIFVHESGESMDGGKLHVPAAKHDPQGFGSALTYARRYSLMAACGIAQDDDDGNAAAKAKEAAGRQKWLADWLTTIEGVHSSGELKRVIADAVADARRYNDTDAEAQFISAGEAKVAKAKAAAVKQEKTSA